MARVVENEMHAVSGAHWSFWKNRGMNYYYRAPGLRPCSTTGFCRQLIKFLECLCKWLKRGRAQVHIGLPGCMPNVDVTTTANSS